METADCTSDIDVGCDPAFERNWGRFAVACWIVMVVLLLAGVSGLLGHGPLSEATVNAPGGEVQVHYERLARRQAMATLKLHLDRRTLASGQVRIRLNRDLVDRLRIQNIVPTPVSTEPLADGACFTFRTDPTLNSATVLFIENPLTAGIFEGEVVVEGTEPVRFRQYVYP